MLFYFLRFCLRLRKVITCLVLVDLEIALVDLGKLKEKILQTYKGHMGLVQHYLFKKFHELILLLLIIEVRKA